MLVVRVRVGGGSGVRRRLLVAESQANKVMGARKVSKREAPTIMMNTRCKGSVGAKACEFVVQPTPNMCGLGGSAERPAVQRRTIRFYYQEQSGVVRQDCAWSASTA